MGSSIGLVVYQSRQFFFLNRLSRHDLTSHSPSNPLFNTTFPDPGAHLHHNHHGQGHGHGHGHGHRRRIKYLIFSTWLPVLVWILSLIATIVLITRRKWVPKIMSAKSGILMSQAIFSLFWVLLGSIQEVQEKLIMQRTALARGESVLQEPTHGLTGEGGLPIDIPYLARSKIRAMLIPLCLVWYLAVVLLGIATGMLASSSSIMERRLADAYHEAVDQEDEKYTESAGLLEKEEKESTEDVHGTQVLATMTKTTSDESERPLPRYTSKERIALGALILSLFVSQMRLFQWIVRNQTLAAYITGTSVSVSSCVTMVGLVSGLVLIVLGVRSLPAL